jgi:uncharacterized membrane protein YdbT with pleckstrin-like domain
MCRPVRRFALNAALNSQPLPNALPPPAARVLIWAALAVVLLYRRLTVRYRLTTYRFFHETGLLSRTRNRVEVIDINDVTLKQGIIERMFEVGTIHIQSSDVTHPELDLPGIESVRQVTDLIDNTRRAERQRRGVFMENIGPQTPGSGTFAAR